MTSLDVSPKIGILGAPDSGKYDLAKEIASQWPAGLGDTRPEVIRTASGEDIYGLTLGSGGSWRSSLALYGKLLEERNQLPAAPVIEVGTCFDRIAHCGSRLRELSSNLLDPLFSDTEREELLHLQQALPCLAIAFVETWNYDYAFYLPTPDDSDPFVKGVDSALLELLESYMQAGTPLNVLRLDFGSSSDRAATVLSILEELEPTRLERLKEVEMAEHSLQGGIGNESNGVGGEAPEGA